MGPLLTALGPQDEVCRERQRGICPLARQSLTWLPPPHQKIIPPQACPQGPNQAWPVPQSPEVGEQGHFYGQDVGDGLRPAVPAQEHCWYLD